jgi:hypothetical protein
LTKRFQRGSLAFSARGGYDYSLGSAEDLGFRQFGEVGISTQYQLTRRVDGSLFCSYLISDYLDTIPKQRDETVSAGAGLSFQPVQWMTIGLNYIFISVDSNTGTDYVENRGMVSVTIAPEVPYRW